MIESASILNEVLDEISDLFQRVSPEGRILQVNKAWTRTLGYSEEEATSLGLPQLLDPSCAKKGMTVFRSALSGVVVRNVPVTFRAKSGKRVSLDWTTQAHSVNGKVVSTRGILQDNSERRLREADRVRFQRAMTRANRDIAAVLRLTDNTVGRMNLDTLLRTLLERTREVMGADTAVLLVEEGERLLVRASAGLEREDWAEYAEAFGEGFAGRIAATREPLFIENTHRDSRFASRVPRVRNLRSLLGVPLLREDVLVGVLHVGWLGLHARDDYELHLLEITAERCAMALINAELFASLSRSEARFRRLADAGLFGVLVANFDGRWSYANDEFRRLAGDAHPGEPMDSTVGLPHRGWCPLEPADMENLRTGGLMDPREMTLARSDGTGIPVMCGAARLEHSKGEFIAFFVDLSEKYAADAMRQRYAAIVESTGDGIVGQTTEGIIDAWTGGAEALFGFTAQEAIGRPLSIITPATRLAEEMEVLGETLKGRVCRSRETIRIHREGGEVHVSVTTSPVRGEGGKVVGASSIYRDISERKRTEERIRATNVQLSKALEDLGRYQRAMLEQERLRALGEMASGVAHDLNNSLTPILGYSDLLLASPAKLTDIERVCSHLNIIRMAAQDATHIVRRLRAFYGKREAGEALVAVDLNSIVQEAVDLTRPRWQSEAQSRGVNVQLTVAMGDVPEVAGIAPELREALVNLIFNAVDAITEMGAITIRTGVLPPDGRHRSKSLGLDVHETMAPWVFLEVRDTGSGMPEEVRRRCLEPFFSTKGERGTGMGLAMVYGIVLRHEGRLSIESTPGSGTSIVMYLREWDPQVVPARADVPASARVSLRVLVVEDDPAIRTLISEVLTTAGHHVQTAVSGADGLAKMSGAAWDMVLTDRAMPEMGGDEFALQVKARSPGTPVLMVTGFGSFLMAEGKLPGGVDGVVGKPLTVDTLLDAVHRLSASGRRQGGPYSLDVTGPS